ncbi:MAG TPA: hypothetical protein VE129_01705 [Thermoanaerobaculia bacterium]|nr:hypothetical protein [Thermoanaerobaculia bacterium]
MTGRPLLRATALAAALALPSSANATTITIVNMDAAGVGFNDPAARTPVGGNSGTTLGEQRMNVFKYAAAFWAQRLDSPVEVKVQAKFEALTCSSTSAVLGSAGTRYIFSDFTGAPRPKTWYSSALANKLAGEDMEPAEDDISARFTTALDDGSCSFPRKWHYGLDAQPAGGTTDFATVVIHELGHGLGFQTFVSRSTGEKFAGDDGVGLDDAYMVHLYDATAGKTWSQMTDSERLTSTVNTSNLLWNGPEVTAVASSSLSSGVGAGGRAQIYAPNPSESGSSVSHWDTALFPNEIMEPFITTALHSLLITDELMKDLGWSLASGSPTNSWLVPSSARAPGAGGAFFTTSISIGNRGSAEAKYKLKFLGNNTDGTGGPESSEFVLGPNQAVTYEDVLGSVFGLTQDFGAIRLTANVATLNVLGQTSTPDPSKPGGTFGQSVPAFAAADLLTSGALRSVVGIREDTSFRTNLILANAGTAQVKVTGTLLSASGAVLGAGEWTLDPLGMTQVTRVVRDLGVTGNVRDAQLLLTTSTTGGSFAAYATVIDNITNDPRTLLPR